ncbi:universal stress protein [Nibrella saemangeumensis]|uniref:Universal stress protein n=1 Tax=Nibrella saemangeumensis TaxID=1084526 RepID=A0ABP8MGH2_9BACT
MQTILVPTDLSDLSLNALKIAADICRTRQAKILLLHVVPMHATALTCSDISFPVGTYDLQALLQENITTALEELHQITARPEYQGIPIETAVCDNTDGLAESILSRPADLIVMASKGTSDFEKFWETSNTETVVRFATCPVLVIKDPIQDFRPEKILYAVDVDDQLKKWQRYPFQLNQGSEDVDGYFLYVYTPSDNRDTEAVRGWIEELALSKGMAHYDIAIRSDKTAAEGIISYAEEIEADIIVLFTHGRKGVEHLLLGSVAADVLNHTQSPVLIMRL